MKKKQARDIVQNLGVIAKHIHEGTKAPVVIVLCMSAITGGTVLASCVGARGPVELATALRYAADYTDHEKAEHLHLRYEPEGPS